MAAGFVVHGVLLGAEYAKLPNLFRQPDDSQGYFGYMLFAHLLYSIAFVWIYRQGRTDRPFVAQGFRYGCAVALLTVIPTYLIYYAVQPMPGAIVARQIVFDSIGIVILGVMVAWLNREPATTLLGKVPIRAG